jgi:hypothetical protein
MHRTVEQETKMTTDPDRDKKIAKLRAEIENLAKNDLLLETIEADTIRTYSAHLPAHRSSRSFFPFGGSSCSKTDILVLSGRETTNHEGITKLSLRTLLCGVVNEGLASGTVFTVIREPNFVATPHGSLPSFATVLTNSTLLPPGSYIVQDRDNNQLSRVSPLADVTVDIRTWKHDGSPAAKTLFSWICTVEVSRLIAFG